MIDSFDGWSFLYEFYSADKSIVNLINQAIRIKSKKSVRDDSFENLKEDLLSLLQQDLTIQSYEGFLNHVFPNSEKAVDEKEDRFLNHFWINILSRSDAKSSLSKKFQDQIRPELLPYLILFSLDISSDWFLYGGTSAYFFVDNDQNIKKLGKSLQKGYKKWQNRFSWKEFYNFFNPRHSSDDLYPLMTLLILLRREWMNSKSMKYVYDKLFSLMGLHYPPSTLNDAVLYALYKNYDEADESIINNFDNNVPTIKIHPIIAQNIINNHAYDILFTSEYLENSGEMSLRKDEIYKSAEKDFEKNPNRKRLLADYLFPYTIVRENDVFIPRYPKSPITDLIFLSLSKGKNYKEFLRKPKENELFEVIQIEPLLTIDGEENDKRLNVLYKNLSDTGDFYFVRSQMFTYNEVSKFVAEAFSNFRHDLKDLMQSPCIDLLQRNLITLQNLNDKFNKLFDEINLFINNSNDKGTQESLKSKLEELYKDNGIKKMSPKLHNLVDDTLTTIEEYLSEESQLPTNSLRDFIHQIKSVLANIQTEKLKEQIEWIGNVEFKHDILCGYIKVAGTNPSKKDVKEFNFTDFLTQYKKQTSINNRRAEIVFEPSEDIKDLSIKYDKNILIIMLNSILDNAVDHGFPEEYKCEKPTIKFIATKIDGFLLLKICNNGKPITFGEDYYKSRGAFSGPTGHTGLGGYQINKYAEMFGGYVRIPDVKDREWNTEIHLYINLKK